MNLQLDIFCPVLDKKNNFKCAKPQVNQESEALKAAGAKQVSVSR